jgi:hypothetical protein
MKNNTRQVFHTQEFDYPEWPPVLSAATNEKEESDSHLPRFFSVSHVLPERELRSAHHGWQKEDG